MRRRKIDGCPVAGALQMIGDKWSMLVVRDLANGPRRTMELINGLFPDHQAIIVADGRMLPNHPEMAGKED